MRHGGMEVQREGKDGITIREFMKKSAKPMVPAMTSGLLLLRSRLLMYSSVCGLMIC